MKFGPKVIEYFAAVKDSVPVEGYSHYGHTPYSVAGVLQSLLSGAVAGVDEFERAANVFEPYRYDSDELGITCNRLLAAMFELQGIHYSDPTQKQSIQNYIRACLIRSGDIDASRN